MIISRQFESCRTGGPLRPRSSLTKMLAVTPSPSDDSQIESIALNKTKLALRDSRLEMSFRRFIMLLAFYQIIRQFPHRSCPTRVYRRMVAGRINTHFVCDQLVPHIMEKCISRQGNFNIDKALKGVYQVLVYFDEKINSTSKKSLPRRNLQFTSYVFEAN